MKGEAGLHIAEVFGNRGRTCGCRTSAAGRGHGGGLGGRIVCRKAGLLRIWLAGMLWGRGRGETLQTGVGWQRWWSGL